MAIHWESSAEVVASVSFKKKMISYKGPGEQQQQMAVVVLTSRPCQRN